MSQTVTLIYNPNTYRDAEVHVHAADCRDIGKDRRGATTVYDTTAATEVEVVEGFYCDLLAEDMTLADAVSYVRFLPCVKGLA